MRSWQSLTAGAAEWTTAPAVKDRQDRNEALSVLASAQHSVSHILHALFYTPRTRDTLYTYTSHTQGHTLGLITSLAVPDCRNGGLRCHPVS